MRTVAPAAALAVWLAGCASLGVSDPTNQPLSGSATAAFASVRQDPSAGDDVMVGLAFSGGGTRAAAFAHGVLQELDQTTARSRSGTNSLLDRVGFVSGVSGGAVAAAYFGLKKRAAVGDFREKFLIRNAEESLSTNITAVNLVKGLSGGVNDVRTFARWLNDNLYNGATFADFRKASGPQIWLNASDIYNRTPFIYGATTFGALCSDLASYPIAEAVAASAAVPIVFTPMVIRTYPKQCTDRPSEGVEKAHNNPNAPPMLKAFADALASYGDGSTKYIKLLDGGLVDNFGLSGFTIARLAARAPYDPLSPERAVRLRRAIIILVDAGRAPSGNWVQTIDGPSGMELVNAASDTALQASVLASYTAFQATLNDYQRQLVNWRCGLSPEQRKRHGAGPNWNCRDIKLILTRVAFEQLGAARAKVLNAVDTRFKLPVEQVDTVIAAGRDALSSNPQYREFLKGLGAQTPQPVPEAPPLPSEPPPTPVATAPSWPFPFPSLPSSFAAQ
ncbi:MAG: patatin-like phospholipase family protein [Xanthobacteraceae bacterium]|nr:patatin-like phospholipase family protein [Xanthobacteraceae bacterium]MBX9844841.1 patatin-like phospholipase family protein [Xanthobacteraceae bacterium]